MTKRFVRQYGTNKKVAVELDPQFKAVLGVNVYLQDGVTLLDLTNFVNVVSTTGSAATISGATAPGPQSKVLGRLPDQGVTPTNISFALPFLFKGDLLGYNGSYATRLPVGTNGWVLTADSAQALGLKWAPASGGSCLPAFFDFTAGGSALQAGGITTAAKCGVAGTIASWTLAVLATDSAATVVVDVLKTSVGGFGVGVSITGSAQPTLTAAKAATGSTLTGWTTALSAGDVLYAKIVSITGNIKGLSLQLNS